LLESGFNVVIHSTGALVIRTWIKLFSPKPSPIRNLVYLAGANLGSGWASIGQGQVARWGRFVFERGAQRGLKVLQSLELGAAPTIDLHLSFARGDSRMVEDYKVQEFVIVGAQADASWFEFPVRYAHEDGSDGVVRVSAANLNFNHLEIGPKDGAPFLPWAAIKAAVQAAEAKADFPEYYEVKSASFAGKDRPLVPCGIPYRCAHTGDKTGIVSGTIPQDQVERMLKLALETPERTPTAWQRAVAAYDREIGKLRSARKMQSPAFSTSSQIRAPIRSARADRIRCATRTARRFHRSPDVFFVEPAGERTSHQMLIQDTSVSGVSPNSILFYLRVQKFIRKEQNWVDQLRDVFDFALEITAIEPMAQRENPLVSYLPLRLPLNRRQMSALIQPHRTTIIDVTLLRLPAPEVYQLIKS
jgi:hypothetical protein